MRNFFLRGGHRVLVLKIMGGVRVARTEAVAEH